MGNVRIELNVPGIWELMRSPEAKEMCKKHADDIARRLGDGYKTDTFTGMHRVNASIGPESEEAWRDTLENNTILKTLKGGSG